MKKEHLWINDMIVIGQMSTVSKLSRKYKAHIQPVEIIHCTY